MTDSKYILIDPWLKKGGKTTRLPADALLACAYDPYIGPDTIEEAAFFRRTATADELWVVAAYVPPPTRGITARTASFRDIPRERILGIGCAFAVRRRGEESSACLDLLDRLFRARVGFCWPEAFLAAGIVPATAFNGLVGRIARELQENAAKARERESEIVSAARELGLSPQPTGTGPDYWWARCPGRNHPLDIDAAKNLFLCGWCRRNGAVRELRALVNERGSQGA